MRIWTDPYLSSADMAALRQILGMEWPGPTADEWREMSRANREVTDNRAKPTPGAVPGAARLFG